MPAAEQAGWTSENKARYATNWVVFGDKYAGDAKNPEPSGSGPAIRMLP